TRDLLGEGRITAKKAGLFAKQLDDGTRIAVFNHFRSLIIRQSVAVQRVVAAYDNGWLFVFYVNVSPARVSADAVQHFDLQILPQVVGADKWRAGQHGVLVHYDDFKVAIRAPLRRLQ